MGSDIINIDNMSSLVSRVRQSRDLQQDVPLEQPMSTGRPQRPEESREGIVRGGNIDEKNLEKNKDSSTVTFEQLQSAADDGNSLFKAVRRNLEIQVHKETDEMVVKVVDSETGELIRQVPSEEMLKFLETLKKQGIEGGLILQDRA